MCEYCVKVGSYAGICLQHRRIAHPSQVKLKVKLAIASNTALILRLLMHELYVLIVHCEKILPLCQMVHTKI